MIKEIFWENLIIGVVAGIIMGAMMINGNAIVNNAIEKSELRKRVKHIELVLGINENDITRNYLCR